MNKFNAQRKVKARMRKKHGAGKNSQHQRQVQQVSGKRTAKSQKKADRQRRLKMKKAIAAGDIDVHMGTAEAAAE